MADEMALQGALAGCETAFYLVHSLSAENFRARDHQLAMAFGRAAAVAGLRGIVYLGGLGHDPESEHLVSRQEVGTALASGDVPVVELRAAVVLGAGGISFEMLRYLTERLPFMVCPRWVRTAIQPIALADMIRYLIGAIDVEPGVYEVGGAEVTSYREMIAAYATARGLRRRRIVDVSYLTPRLSSYWLDLVTRFLGPAARRLATQHPACPSYLLALTQLAAALSAALDDQADELDESLMSRGSGLRDGEYTVRVTVPYSNATSARLDAELERIGGSYSWYGLPFAWRVRALVGRLIGEYWKLSSHRRLAKAPLLTGGSSFDVTAACSCCALFAGFPEKHGSAIDVVRRSSSKSAHFARRESPGSSTGSRSNRCIDASSRRLHDTGSRALHKEEPDCCEQIGTPNNSLNGEGVRARRLGVRAKSPI